MGAMRRASVWLGLMPDEDPEYDDPGYGHEPDEPRRPRLGRSLAYHGTRHPDRDDRYQRDDLDDAFAPQAHFQIAALRPTSFSDARTIGEYFRDGVPVIMNLSGLDGPDAKRLVDFASGLIFGLRGTIDRIANRVFILVPAGVDVVGNQRGLRSAHHTDP